MPSGNGNRRRQRFRYHKPAHERRYEPGHTVSWFAENDVPTVAHHQSLYLHSLNVLLEEINEDEDAIDEFDDRKTEWGKIQLRVMAFMLRNRNDLSVDHRMLSWVVWSRIHNVLCRCADKYDDIQTHAELASLRLRAAPENVPVRLYSVATLWRAMMILAKVWGVLTYTDFIRDYVLALASQCGAFHWASYADTNKRVFDHPIFTTTVGEQAEMAALLDPDNAIELDPATARERCVTNEFTIETERVIVAMFATLQSREDMFRGCSERTVCAPLPQAQRRKIVTWLAGAITNSTLRPAVVRMFSAYALESRVQPGERQRFEAADQFIDSTPYNLVSKYRPAQLDETMERYSKVSRMQEFLDLLVTGPKQNRNLTDNLTDISDANALAFYCACFLFDSAFSAEVAQFSSHFCVTAPSACNFAIRKDRPLIVWTMGMFVVRFKDKAIQCPDATSAIWTWLSEFCGAPEVVEASRSVAPTTDVFFDTYRLLTANQTDTQSAAEKHFYESTNQRLAEMAPSLALPRHYRKRAASGANAEEPMEPID